MSRARQSARCTAGATSRRAVRSYAPCVIRVEDLVKRYKKAETNAVDGISFQVKAGEFFVLLGPNGAGKTTTISILTTTLSPTSGRATIDGSDIGREASAVRRKVGSIFQYAPTYGLMARGYRAKVEELAKLLGIARDIHKPVKTFSGGMRRKLEIMRSLLHDPKVLFLDEPTAGLDVPTRRTLWEHLSEVRRTSGTTVFLTTHYLEEAEEADRICIIDKGKVVSFGTPDDIKRDLVEEYLLVDAADRSALRDELARLGHATSGGAPFKVQLDGNTVHSILRSIETPLTVVKTHTPSLEDAYLEIVSGTS